MDISLLNAKKRVKNVTIWKELVSIFSCTNIYQRKVQFKCVFYLLSQQHMSFCTLLLYQNGSGSPHSLRTRTERRRWLAGRSTSGCYSPGKSPDPGAAHNGGQEIQLLNIDKRRFTRLHMFKSCPGENNLQIFHQVTFFCY